MATDSRTITVIGDYLDNTARSTPEVKEAYTELNALVQKKLWHQVSVQLLSFLSQASMQPHILSLQENVVSKIYKKMAPLDYVRWAVAVAGLVGGGGNVAEGLKHLEATLPHVQAGAGAGAAAVAEQDEQAILLLQLEISRRQLSSGVDSDTIKMRLADSKRGLDHYSGVMDARVYAAYYQAMYEYSKLSGNPQEYYTNSLLYLTYTPLADIAPQTRQALASDIGLAALLGANIYNFGELLQHPILASLDSTEYAWLPKMLQAFNAGNIQEFNTIFETVKGKYPTLAANAAFLNQKLRIMTLMELVFRLPSGKAGQAAAAAASSPSDQQPGAEARGRVLTFDAISSGCDIPREQVEWLLMKSLALKVIRGSIDQVAQTIRLKWVSPRVLDRKQIQSLQTRLSTWQNDVEQTTVYVENNAQDVI